MTTENTAPNEEVVLSLSEASVGDWQKCFSKTIAGYKIEVCLEISANGNGQVILGIKACVGTHCYHWTKTVSGNITFTIPIYGPISLTIAITDWKLESSRVCFNLKVSLQVIISVTLYNGSVCIPLPHTAELDTLSNLSLSSPHDVVQLFQLLAELDREEDQESAVGAGGACYKGKDCTGAFQGYYNSCASCARNGGRSLETATGCQQCRG